MKKKKIFQSVTKVVVNYLIRIRNNLFETVETTLVIGANLDKTRRNKIR